MKMKQTRHTAKMSVPQSVACLAGRALSQCNGETLFDQEVTFSNGHRMAIQMIAPDTLGETPWTQGVLFDEAGNELDYTEVYEDLLDTFITWVTHDDDSEDVYEVEVGSHWPGDECKVEVAAPIEEYIELDPDPDLHIENELGHTVSNIVYVTPVTPKGREWLESNRCAALGRWIDGRAALAIDRRSWSRMKTDMLGRGLVCSHLVDEDESL